MVPWSPDTLPVGPGKPVGISLKNARVSVIPVVLRANFLTEQRNAKAHWVSEPTLRCWVEMSPEAPEKRRLVYLSQTRKQQHIVNTSFSLAGKFWSKRASSSLNMLLHLTPLPATPPHLTPASFRPRAFTLRVAQCEITRPNRPITGRFLAGLRPLCKCAWAEEMIEINNYRVGSWSLKQWVSSKPHKLLLIRRWKKKTPKNNNNKEKKKEKKENCKRLLSSADARVKAPRAHARFTMPRGPFCLQT